MTYIEYLKDDLQEGRRKKTLEYVFKLNPKRVLDVGGGEAITSYKLAVWGIDTTVIDIGNEFSKKLNDIAKEENLPLEYFGSTNLFKFEPEDKFDVVFSMEVIEHLKKWKKAIVKMINMADREVVITTPVRNKIHDPGHIQSFRKKDFKWIKELEEVEKLNIEIIEVPIKSGKNYDRIEYKPYVFFITIKLNKER